MPESVFILMHLSPCKACWEIWVSDEQRMNDNDNGRRHCGSPEMPGSQPNPQRNWKLEDICYKTNLDLCRIPGHGPQGQGSFVRNPGVPDKPAGRTDLNLYIIYERIKNYTDTYINVGLKTLFVTSFARCRMLLCMIVLSWCKTCLLLVTKQSMKFPWHRWNDLQL